MSKDIEPLITTEVMPNVSAFVHALRAAYKEADALVNSHRLFKGRNVAVARGHARYFFVHASLWNSYERDELTGLTAKWETMSNSLEHLLLETPTFLIEPVHLPMNSTKPRSSITRKKAVVSNQRIFSEMEAMFGDPEGAKVHLFLAHGYRQLDAAHILCVDNLEPGDRDRYRSANLLSLTAPEEAVAPPEATREFAPSLKESVLEKVAKAIGA